MPIFKVFGWTRLGTELCYIVSTADVLLLDQSSTFLSRPKKTAASFFLTGNQP